MEKNIVLVASRPGEGLGIPNRSVSFSEELWVLNTAPRCSRRRVAAELLPLTKPEMARLKMARPFTPLMVPIYQPKLPSLSEIISHSLHLITTAGRKTKPAYLARFAGFN